MKRSVLALAIAGSLLMAQGAMADGGDFQLDFTAAAPLTYDHTTGGGAYDQRAVGRDKDIVESLEGGDFACGDTVTYLTQIRVDAGAAGSQSITMLFEFTAHATGQQGIALRDNIAGTSGAINQAADDTGTVDDGGSTAAVGNEIENGTAFVKPTKFLRVVTVDDLESGETVVLRTDVRIDCDGRTPTGNMQAKLLSTTTSEGDAVPGGVQTIPFKRVEDVKKPPPPK